MTKGLVELIQLMEPELSFFLTMFFVFSLCSSRLEPVSSQSTPQGSGAATPDNHSNIDTLSEQGRGDAHSLLQADHTHYKSQQLYQVNMRTQEVSVSHICPVCL